MSPTSIFDCSDTTLTKYRGRRKHLAEFPSGIDTIGKMAFFGKKSLESVVLPQGLTNIGFFSFMDCKNLKSIVIPPTVSSIGMYAFAGCESLESIAIPDHLEHIGVGILDGCINLKSVCLPSCTEDISGILLCDCKKLEKVEFGDDTQANLEAIKKEGAKIRRMRAKDIRDGKFVMNREAWAKVMKLSKK